MFEMEDFSSGYETHGLLNKYSDFAPTLDMYISDSIQDILDIDIRSEIATVLGGSSEFASLIGDLPSINNNSTNSSSSSTSNLHTANNTFSSSWLGTSPTGSTWSTTDFYADVGACVNPISVMPLINSSLLHKSPKTNLNGLQQCTTSPPPASPNETKSHLTFSPAQIKVSSGSIRHEQILSHIPKQIVSISSTVTAATTAPATMATNSLLQRKNVAVTVAAVDAIKKDLGAELRKVSVPSSDETKNSVGSLLNGSTTTNTIKLGPGIGGLTFANSITYNKLKQQSAAKSPLGSPLTANGTIVLKRDRDSSPLHHMTTLNANNGGGSGGGNGQHITKILSRSSFTPKSIASAHSPLMPQQQQQHSSSVGSPCSSSSSVSSSHSSPAAIINGAFTAGLAPISNSNHHNHHNTSTLSSSSITSIAVKPLQQKIKVAPVESEYPKPAYSYSCLIAMALKNSRSGSLPVSEIYSFMCEHFPYFKTAPSGWKNSVRHNLSLNNSFEKIEKPATNGSQRKGCLWAMNPGRIAKMDEEVQKWSRKDPMAIRNAMVYPEHLDALERGEMKHGTSGDSDVELDSQSEIEETSDLEEHELDENIVENMFVEEDIEEEEEVEMHHDGSSGGGGVCSGSGGSGIRVGVINGDDVRSTGRVQNHHHRDFDIEVSLEAHTIGKSTMLYEKVEDIYDAIDMEDRGSKRTISESDIIELSPADINAPAQQQNNSVNGGGVGDYQSPKRARLNINYSIGPARELEKQIHHQQLHQNIRQIKVQQQQQHSSHSHHNQQQQQRLETQQQQQHIVVQTITNTGGNGLTTTTTQTSTPLQHFQHFTAIPNHNRRKMQLVNRIA